MVNLTKILKAIGKALLAPPEEDDDEGSEEFECPECGEGFQTERGKNIHLAGKHPSYTDTEYDYGGREVQKVRTIEDRVERSGSRDDMYRLIIPEDKVVLYAASSSYRGGVAAVPLEHTDIDYQEYQEKEEEKKEGGLDAE